METVLITGGTGIIGSQLIPQLLKKEYQVRILSRAERKIKDVDVYTWDINTEFIQQGALENIDHIIHLAGYSVSEGRWTSKRKKLIEDSRIKAIAVIKKHLGNEKLKTFISASGVSIYGTRTTYQIYKEDDPIQIENDDYLGHVSVKWEAATTQLSENAERIVCMRTPVVLSQSGGALEKISKPIKMGFGSALGSGKQWMPWVHVNDLVAAYLTAIKDSNMQGSFNICAPEHISNKDFTKSIAKVLGKKIWLPKVPGFILKLMFGQMANIILKGSRVSGKKLETLGLEYQFKSLEESIKDLLHN